MRAYDKKDKSKIHAVWMLALLIILIKVNVENTGIFYAEEKGDSSKVYK